jgi:hypothetical protein
MAIRGLGLNNLRLETRTKSKRQGIRPVEMGPKAELEAGHPRS